MRKILFLSALCAIGFGSPVFAQHSTKPMLKHIVMFKFKETASAENIQSLIDAFKALKGSISEVKAFEWGTNNSPEKLNEGLTHCFQATFASEADRDAYLVAPPHKAFVEKFAKPYVDKAVVVDYWVK